MKSRVSTRELKKRLHNTSPASFARLMYAYRGGRALVDGLRSAVAGTPKPFTLLQVEPIPSTFVEPRLTLLLPTIEDGRSFGGINTALDFWRSIAPKCSNVRLVSFDPHDVEASPLAAATTYTLVPGSLDSNAPRQIIHLGDKETSPVLCVGSADVFVATHWQTAVVGRLFNAWQAREFGSSQRLAYFIQDFEPGFYPWSTEYVLADSTYDHDVPTVAIFNSEDLKKYFNSRHYRFEHEYVFDPVLNRALRDQLDVLRDSPKSRTILVYGRPSSPRNAFHLIAEGLRIWGRTFPKAADWTILSAGEVHGDISLGHNVVIRSVGKLSIDRYARLLAQSAVGISLMVSPHPSYPPLEMAHFGSLVLSNNFANKDISKYHDNITSLDIPSPERIAAALSKLCERYEAAPQAGWSTHSRMSRYLGRDDQFPFVDELYDRLLGQAPALRT